MIQHRSQHKTNRFDSLSIEVNNKDLELLQEEEDQVLN